VSYSPDETIPDKSMSHARPSRGFATRAINPASFKAMATPRHDPATALEACMADREGGAQSFAFTSGRAAIGCLAELVNSGAHVIVSDGLHGGRYRLLEDVRRRSGGLRISYVDPTDRDAVKAAVEDATKMIWVESPVSPRATLTDLDMIASVAAEHELISICDNTDSTPYLQRPLAHGFNISLHSAPGYLHGGVLAQGAIAVVAEGQDFLVDKLGFLRSAIGAVPSTLDSDLALRSLASLPLRMERICDNAGQIAAFLAGHRWIKQVFYPGLAEHPRPDLVNRQMRRAGGVMAVIVAGGTAEAREFLDRLQLFSTGEGPGGPGSWIDNPVLSTFGAVPPEIRAGMGLADGLFRIWTGIEDSDDLINDLRAALG
jgi:cystathionine gamma-lyase